MPRPPSTPANVLYLRIRGYGALDAAGQKARRARLGRTLIGLVRLWPEDGRIVVRAPDGAAIVGLDDPAIALEAARQAVLDPDLDVGLHHGPVRTRSRDASQLVGEGLETAQAITGISTDHPFLATSDFRRALQASAPHLGRALRTAGHFVDARAREQRLHAPDTSPPEPPPPSRRRQLMLGGAGLAAVLAAGILVRVLRPDAKGRR
jgi:hypothetical protein